MGRSDYRVALRQLLRESKISQRELARRLNVTEAVISQLLSPKGNPTIRTLARIATVCDRYSASAARGASPVAVA